MGNRFTKALADATGNALKVLWTGSIAFGLYVALIMFGPGVEGRFFPVLQGYSLTHVRAVAGGGFSFRPEFYKARDCTYYGVSWFAQDASGNLTRVQLSKMELGPPETGPTGQRKGGRQTLFPPPGSHSIFGINHHDCGAPWQTRTLVGPFAVPFAGVPDWVTGGRTRPQGE